MTCSLIVASLIFCIAIIASPAARALRAAVADDRVPAFQIATDGQTETDRCNQGEAFSDVGMARRSSAVSPGARPRRRLPDRGRQFVNE